MDNKKEELALISLVVFALLLGAGFYVYYLNKPQPGQLKQKNNQKVLSEAEQYIEKIQVVFTNEEVPASYPQHNPRLKVYVGKIKNTGDKTLSYVNIKVVYLDKNEKAIWEKEAPISVALRPNYIQEFSFGGSDVPSEWAGKVTYEITEIRFENDKAIHEIPSYYYHDRGLNRPLQQILFPLF